MSISRSGVACAVLNGKLYAIGGQDKASVESLRSTDRKLVGRSCLPSEVNHGTGCYRR